MNKTNWQIESDKILANLGEKRRMLLHVCCAPCSSASLEYLTNYFDIDVYFYNPNIETKAEYEKRLFELERFIKEYGFSNKINVLVGEYNHDDFLTVAKGLENAKEGGERCVKCFEQRLSQTAKKAQEKGYGWYATTLTISPLKNADLLNKIGLHFGKVEDVCYFPTDLKKKGRYQRSIELSKIYNLYRQDFCGCEFSRKAREAEKQNVKDNKK